jgi:hypothetical protein
MKSNIAATIGGIIFNTTTLHFFFTNENIFYRAAFAQCINGWMFYKQEMMCSCKFLLNRYIFNSCCLQLPLFGFNIQIFTQEDFLVIPCFLVTHVA